MPFSYTVLVLVVIGAALIWGATLDSQGRIVVARAGKAGTPQFQPSLKVFGMYCSLPARAYGVLGGKPGVFRPASIHDVLWRENHHRAISDFCNNICQDRTRAVQQKIGYSITSSARPMSEIGMVSPSALAGFKLMVSSILTACWNGRSAGLGPLRISHVRSDKINTH